MLKINVLSLKDDPVDVFVDIPPGRIVLDAELKLIKPVEVRFGIQRVGEKVFIRGELKTQLMLTCSRCLEMYTHVVHEKDIFFVAIPKFLSTQRRQSENEQLQEEEPAMMVYEADQLDLLPEIHNILILAIPMKPLCSSKCPGLCLYCGEKKHSIHCECIEKIRENPFSVLKNIK